MCGGWRETEGERGWVVLELWIGGASGEGAFSKK